MTRVGLIGIGFIGAQVYRRIVSGEHPDLEVAFVHNRDPAALAEVDPALRLASLAGMRDRAPDLVVEMAHPDITRVWGEAILGFADYLPLSATALADPGRFERMCAVAGAHGRQLAIPHGALMGADNLFEGRARWREVDITFIKSPASIDFSACAIDPAQLREESVVYDGPVRGIAPLFPRNVNTMVTCALATVGLDRCRARLIARPGIDHGVIEVRAVGDDGAVLEMRKQQPMAGVSGTEMLESQWHSILRAAGARAATTFV